MVGENFEIHFFKQAENALQSSTMVEEIFEIHFFKVAKNAPQSSTIVGENFETHFFEMAKNALKCPDFQPPGTKRDSSQRVATL